MNRCDAALPRKLSDHFDAVVNVKHWHCPVLGEQIQGRELPNWTCWLVGKHDDVQRGIVTNILSMYISPDLYFLVQYVLPYM